MIIDTKKAIAAAALIVAMGGATVELTRSPALAESNPVQANATYAVSRVVAAFDAAADAPPVTPIGFPVATKGDLPIPLGCFGDSPDAQAECMDVAYEVPSKPSIVVETRVGNTSTLMRMDAITVAEFGEIFDRTETEIAQ